MTCSAAESVYLRSENLVKVIVALNVVRLGLEVKQECHKVNMFPCLLACFVSSKFCTVALCSMFRIDNNYDCCCYFGDDGDDEFDVLWSEKKRKIRVEPTTTITTFNNTKRASQRQEYVERIGLELPQNLSRRFIARGMMEGDCHQGEGRLVMRCTGGPREVTSRPRTTRVSVITNTVFSPECTRCDSLLVCHHVTLVIACDLELD